MCLNHESDETDFGAGHEERTFRKLKILFSGSSLATERILAFPKAIVSDDCTTFRFSKRWASRKPTHLEQTSGLA